MNLQIQYGLIATAILGLGIFLGYLLFGRQEAPVPADITVDTISTWTCSMDPQVRQLEAGDCPICGMELIPATSNTASDPLVLEMTPEAIQLANIQTMIVGNHSPENVPALRLSGRVKLDDRLKITQLTKFPGRIERIYIDMKGEAVRKGQKLADIYSPNLIAAQEELINAQQYIETNPAILEAAREKLRYWDVELTMAEELETQGVIQELFPLYAETSGLAHPRGVAVGDYFDQEDPLFTINSLSRVSVIFDAFEDDLTHIKKGSTISFTTPAYPAKVFEGKINYIDPIIDPETRTASVRVDVPNPAGLLKPEMLVYGQLMSTSSPDGSTLSVPKSAVLWTGKRSIVYVRTPGTTVPSFTYREVELGEALGDSYTILQGLSTGEEVVTNGSFTIDAAAQLNNQVSMMNASIGVKQDRLAAIPNFSADVPVLFQTQLETALLAYLQLKDAFVATDAARAATAAQEVVDALLEVDATELSEEALTFWKPQLVAMQEALQKIQTIAQEVEQQRIHFDHLSRAMISTVKAFGLGGKTYYVQYCPMAFDNTGASWLSDQDQVFNPYFGDKMLRCGVVKEQIGG